jgi:hypothetical protein
MTITTHDHDRIRWYLLGKLSDDNRTEVEKSLMASDELFEELLIQEDELIDGYLSSAA